MLLALHSIKSPHSLKLSGTEAWLNHVKRDLAPLSPDAAKIDGDLTLRLTSAGFVNVQGMLNATALQPCSLCGEDVALRLTTPVKAAFRPPYEGQAPKDINLMAEDLDVYFIEGGAINLEVLVNDTLQCALPYQVTCEASGLSPCNAQRPGQDQDRPAAATRSGENSPFSVLKSLKE